MNNFSKWPVPAGWPEAIEEWEKVMIARAFSYESRRTRLQHIRTAARALDCRPEQVTDQLLLEYVSSKQWSAETRNAYYNSFRQFFAWFSSKEGTPNPAIVLPSVRRHVPAPRPIPDEVLAQAMGEATGKDHLILELAALAGLRAGEISRVNVNDLVDDLLGTSLVVLGKGRKQRTVPITAALAEAIRKHAGRNGWIFPWQNSHVSAAWISKRGARLLPDPWTLHTLRHRFGTRAYAQERDLLAVQRLLGHASVATTQIYVAPPDDAMRRAVESAQKVN